jgi:hypothetical protein
MKETGSHSLPPQEFFLGASASRRQGVSWSPDTLQAKTYAALIMTTWDMDEKGTETL